MSALRLLLVIGGIGAVIFQLWKTPRLWAFLFLFIVLFPKLPVAVVPGNPTPVRVDDLLIGSILGLWLVRQIFTPSREIPPSPLTAFLWLYLACALASTLLGFASGTTDFLAGVFHFLRLIEYALIYYFFYRSIDPAEVPDVVRVFRFAWLAVACVWFAQYWMATPPQPGALIDWSQRYPSFSASYDFGGYAMLATTVCYALWTDKQTRSLLTTLALLAGLYIIVNADSRISLLGLAAALGADVLLRLRLRTALGLMAVAAAAPYIVQSRKMERLLGVLVDFLSSFDPNVIQRSLFADPSIGLRLRNWQIALEHWLEKPLVGDGLGTYLQYARIYDLPGTPDGWYIRVLAETGLLGLLTFVMLLGALLWTLMAASSEERQPLARALVYAAALGLFATSVHAFLIDTFVSFKIMGVFWMLMGAATRVAAQGRAQDAVAAPALEPVPQSGT